jgi:hypothetical protein
MAVTTGKISWFTGGKTASGAPATAPGIAVYNHQTLGGYWLIRLPNGHAAVVRQTDIGPAPWTGRTFDFTASLVQSLGYTTKNFPTDSRASGEYLGKTLADVVKNYASAVSDLQLSTDQLPQPGSGGLAFFSQLKKSGVQGVNFDVLHPAGTSAQSYQQATTSAGQTAANVVKTSTDLFGMLTSGAFWLRVLEALGGIILLALGLISLAGGSPDRIAATAARVAK